MNQNQRRVSQLATSIISFLVTLMVLEGIVRSTYNVPWYEKLVTEQGEAKKTVVPLNKWGLRDKEYSSVKKPNVRRVLILGDSFTFGQGVEREEDIFPFQLESMLAQKIGKEVEVLNGGLSGSLTSDWVKLMEQVFPHFKPDLVVVVFSLRDGTLTSSRDNFFGPIRKKITEKNRRSVLYRNSYLYRAARDFLDRRKVAHEYTRALKRGYFGNKKQTREWRNAMDNLLFIQAMATEKEVTTAFVIFPILVQLDKRYPFQDICGRLASFAASHSMPVHDLLPSFMNRDASQLWVSSYDQHPNAEAHQIAAESMAPFLAEILRLCDTRP